MNLNFSIKTESLIFLDVNLQSLFLGIEIPKHTPEK